METKTIYVSRIPDTKKIKLRDSDGNDPGNDDLTTEVRTGDIVEWKLDKNSGLDSLIGIKKKKDTTQLLKGDPTGSNGVFTGHVVDVSPGKDKKMKYKIGYKFSDDKDKDEHWDDPKLQIIN